MQIFKFSSLEAKCQSESVGLHKTGKATKNKSKKWNFCGNKFCVCETVNYQSTPKCCRNCKKHQIRWGYFCRTNHFQQHGCSFSSRGTSIWRGRIRQKFRVCTISVKRPLRPQGHRLPLLKLYAISALSWVFLHIPFALKVFFFFWVKYIFISLVVKFGQFCFWVLRAR